MGVSKCILKNWGVLEIILFKRLNIYLDDLKLLVCSILKILNLEYFNIEVVLF